VFLLFFCHFDDVVLNLRMLSYRCFTWTPCLSSSLQFFFLLLFSVILHRTKTFCWKSLCLIIPCVSSYRWVHSSRDVLFYVVAVDRFFSSSISSRLFTARSWISTEVVYLQRCLVVTWLMSRTWNRCHLGTVCARHTTMHHAKSIQSKPHR